MVKRKNIMRRSLWKSIQSSLGRYIAIVTIIALGASMFVGLKVTKTDMLATGRRFMENQNMFDLRLLSTVGWNADSLERIRALDGVAEAEGMFSLDAIADKEGRDAEEVYRFHSIPESINAVELQGGRMPQSDDECLADGYHADSRILGKRVTISEQNTQSTRDSFRYKTYTIVGYIHTPYYMNMERGTTSLAGGQVSGFLYIPVGGFDVDYYTEIDITMENPGPAYTQQYKDQVSDLSDRLEPLLEPIAGDRAAQVKEDAERAYAEGLQEYRDGVREFEEKQEETARELIEAKEKLEDGQKEIDNNRILLEDGKAQLAEAKKQLRKSEAALNSSAQALAEAKADAYAQLAKANAELLEQYRTVVENRRKVEDGITEIEAGLATIDSYILPAQLAVLTAEMSESQLKSMLSVVDTGIAAAEAALASAEESGTASAETIEALEAKLNELRVEREKIANRLDTAQQEAQTARETLETLNTQKAELESKKEELLATKKTLDEALDLLEIGFREAQNGQIQADNQFAAADAQIIAGRNQIASSEKTILDKEQEISDGFTALNASQAEIDAGWISYREGLQEANRGILEGRKALEDAHNELLDARKTIDGMGDPNVFCLGRDTNAGYTALDSNSDIVSGVAKVFPVFFLLVAALVCITTMTRMVSEERTQIGTLKAMGYTNREIIAKYLAYSGSAAILGCTVGIAIGSTVFPQILWMAYSIMFNISTFTVMKLDWALCLGVAVSYTLVSLAVTWYCCNATLREAPAELIRPKAPTSGKKILLEYLPFWDHIRFLNKVMLRNIFRYRQRFAMMILGIGGCMALLMTGFGLFDSISGFVDYQFDNITTYDMEIVFGQEMDEALQQQFQEDFYAETADITFFSQKNVTMECENGSKDIYLIATDDAITRFVDYHRGEEPVQMPGVGEAILSIGTAEAMNISVGDTIRTRDADLNELELTISGIYDNHVYNYLVVRPETVEMQQGVVPEKQMAFLTVRDGYDSFDVGAEITKDSHVYNVIVSDSLRSMVVSMMDAMNLVIWLVLVCAGLLGMVVLYNLTNININERLREIATLKVLGFYATESAAYVFKENLALSALGGVVGIGFGKLLLNFVMDKIRIDMVWFNTVINARSILFSFLFTMFTAIVVDLIFYPKLEKINMAEALKSVE